MDNYGKRGERMDKQGVYDFLESKKIDFEPVEHGAVWTMEELQDVEIPHKEADAKNLFIRDDKKNNYFLITVRGNKRLDLKAFRKMYELRPLKFCSEDELKSKLNLYAGAVSPFGILNNEEKDVKFFMDEDFLKDDGLIGIHPNDNTATVFLKACDLRDILTGHGNTVMLTKIPEKE